MKKKKYAIIVDAAQYKMILPIKATKNGTEPAGKDQFLGGMPACFGGNLKDDPGGGDNVDFTLREEMDEESGSLLTPDNPLPRSHLMNEKTPTDDMDFYLVDSSHVSGAPGTNPDYGNGTGNRDREEMTKTVEIDFFSLAGNTMSDDEIAEFIFTQTGAPNATTANRTEWLSKGTGKAIVMAARQKFAIS